MTKAIDFSCKHDVLIRHKDGTLTPMDEPYYEVTRLTPNTWQIMSSGDYHYLLTGDEEGIAIDTGYGAGNLREFLEGLCGKPVRAVINTHDHFDHSANNCYFDKAYMAEEGVELAAIPYKSFEGIEFPRDYEAVVVGDGQVIDLKGRPLTIYKIGDHTPSGIAIFDPTERLMFTGDEIMAMGKMVSGTVEKLAADMGKLAAHRAEFDRVCAGGGVLSAEYVDTFYEAAQMILDGKLEPVPDAPGGRGGPGGPGKWGVEHGPNGEIIYDCQRPHPDDKSTAKKAIVDPADLRRYEYKGKHFTVHKIR